MDATVAVVLGVGGLVVAIGSLAIAYSCMKRQKTKDTYQDGSKDSEKESDIKYIMRRTDDILLEQRETNNKIGALTERVTRCEESTKSAHHRLDEMCGKL